MRNIDHIHGQLTVIKVLIFPLLYPFHIDLIYQNLKKD